MCVGGPGAGYTAGRFHPDGKLLGAGTADSAVRIFDVQSQTTAATLSGHAGRITSVAFSENGYHLAVTGEDNNVKLWDLRKLANFKTLTLGDGETANVATFDASASYLAVGGSSSLRYVLRRRVLGGRPREAAGVLGGRRHGLGRLRSLPGPLSLALVGNTPAACLS